MAKLDVPYFQWREGRPRWIPGPKLRAAGFKGRDLKDAGGAWLGMGEAIAAAQRINRDVEEGRAAEAAPQPRTMAALFELILASPRFTKAPAEGSTKKLKLATRTRSEYAAHFRILAEWCGAEPVAQMNGIAIEAFYHDLAEHRGLAMANALMRSLKMAFYYAVKRLRWIAVHPMSGVDMVLPEGRLVVWTPEEFGAFLAAADFLGRESQGDALVMGALTGQRKADVLSLPEIDLASRYAIVAQRKTRGHKAFVPILEPLRARLALARKRRRAQRDHLVVAALLRD